MKRLSKNESGSIAMEYLIVLTFAIPFEIMWLSLYSFKTGYTDFGWLFMDFFQRILAGVSLPIP